MRKRVSKSGITLLELVIVLGIIAILGGTTLTTARGIQRRNLNNASLAFQADIRRAQRMALIEGRRWRVQFDQENHRYLVDYVRPLLNTNWDRTWTYLPAGVTFEFLPRSSVEFLPRGTLGGTPFAVGTGFTMRLQSGQYIQELTVLPVTGRVRIREIQRQNR